MNIPEDDPETRLDGIERQIEWLREHGLEHEDAAQRLGLLKGDVQALFDMKFGD